MEVRAATAADLPRCEPAALEFYNSSQHIHGFEMGRFVAVWSSLIENGTGRMLLLLNGGEVVGFLGAVIYPDIYSAESIATEFCWFVREQHRGEGNELYREFEKWARERGASRIRMAFLHDSMPERLTVLYKRWGYHPIETNWEKELA